MSLACNGIKLVGIWPFGVGSRLECKHKAGPSPTYQLTNCSFWS